MKAASRGGRKPSECFLRRGLLGAVFFLEGLTEDARAPARAEPDLEGVEPALAGLEELFFAGAIGGGHIR